MLALRPSTLAGRPHRGPRRRGRTARRRRLVAVSAAVGLLAAAVAVAVAGPAGPGVRAPGASPAREPADGTAGLRGTSSWLRTFDETWTADRPRALLQSLSGDSWQHYPLSYSVDALTAAYRAGGDDRYASDALLLVENVVGTAVPSRSLPGSSYHDGHRGWASLTGEARGDEVPLYESYFWRYATTLARVILRPGSAADGTAKARARAIAGFAERDVFGKWRDRGADRTIFRNRTHMASHWGLIALNLTAVAQDPGSRAVYAGVVDAVDSGLPGLGASLRGQFRPNPVDRGAAFWSDRWGRTARPGQDVAHGNGVVAFVVEAHDAGVDWTDDDIAALVRLLDRVVWPPGRPPAEFVDGSGTGTGWFSDGFVKLGRYDVALQRRLERHAPANGQFYANLALNARLLGAADRGPTT